MKWFFTALLAFICIISAGAQEKGLQLPDPEGALHSPLQVEGKKGVILFFVSPYCPTANTLMPEINRIGKDHAADFTAYLIHSDPSIKVTDAYQHAVMFKAEATVLLDADQKLAKHVQAKITPEAVVLSPRGEVLYQGRINDLYLGPTKRQRQATTNDLRDALTAIAAGKPVIDSRVEAVGCKITGMQ